MSLIGDVEWGSCLPVGYRNSIHATVFPLGAKTVTSFDGIVTRVILNESDASTKAQPVTPSSPFSPVP
jgi:hypothetical protein